MGGSALKNCVTRRYDKEEYFTLEKEVVGKLKEIFYLSRIEPVKAYSSKESFGDMDVIVEAAIYPESPPGYGITAKWYDTFSPKEFVMNGGVLSFEYKEFQIDLIFTKPEEFESSAYYFAYNDLGNLLGRVSHSMGFQLGHRGLLYKWRTKDGHIFEEIVLLRDWKDILPVLGYSYERYAQGFDTLEDIFKFVVSSPFFNKDIYLLHNRNNKSRVRDRKRKTYMEFLKFCETYEETPEQDDNKHRCTLKKSQWLPYLFGNIPGFKEKYQSVQKEYELEEEYKLRYNGDVVKKVTGLEGVELGNFIKWQKAYFSDLDAFKENVRKINPALIDGWIAYFYEKYLRDVHGKEYDGIRLSIGENEIFEIGE